MNEVHDRALLDALEAADAVPFDGSVWRVARAGISPVQGSAANGRWSRSGAFEVLYTSLKAEGALTEVGRRMQLEPIWPSKLRHELSELAVTANRALNLADLSALAPLGVDVARYDRYDYGATQAIAAAAHFLEFDGLLVPSARWEGTNLVLFMDRTPDVQVIATEPVDWDSWRTANQPRR